MGLAVADAVADGDARRERRAVDAGQRIGLNVVIVLLCVDGLWPCQQDVKLAGNAVLCPLDVHRLRAAGDLRVMVLDGTRPFRKL